MVWESIKVALTFEISPPKASIRGSPVNIKVAGRDKLKILFVPTIKSAWLFSSKTIVCSEISVDGKLQYDIDMSDVDGGVIWA